MIGDPQTIIHRIQYEEAPIVDPYIQLVSHNRDEHTGYWLSDIWRYFRYTWSIPYKTMPGRNLFYLVRDAIQPYHPIIGIFALGNSVLNLTVRDDEIGWTVEAIAKQLKRKEQIDHITQQVSGTNGKTVGAIVRRFLETEEEYPTMDKVNELRRLSEELREQAIDNKKTGQVKSFEAEAKEVLFKKKRAAELARLLEAKIIFNSHRQPTSSDWLKELMSKEEGRKAVNVALVANRKTKIGSNMMEIIVCGAIPPYNELLGGKLVSILACSPQVIRDYTEKYSGQVSEIASRMKGKRVIRDSRLAFLGTTSLYAAGSSQYNRIKVPIADDFYLRYKEMGITEGYGTVYFSKRTTTAMMQMLEFQDGGRRINGLLSIVSHSTNQIFDQNHGKGSLGLAITAILYMHQYPDAVLVGLDTQLAREWLSDRDDGKLPDLIGIRFSDFEEVPPIVDLIEVKTYDDYKISNEQVISGHAVEQVSILEDLILEMFGKNEKITTVSRREILREQVFECLFNNAGYDPNKKQQLTQRLNNLFAGEYSVDPKRNIFHVDFSSAGSRRGRFKDTEGKIYQLLVIGSETIRAILTNQSLDTCLIEFVEIDAMGATQPIQQETSPAEAVPEEVQPDEQNVDLTPFIVPSQTVQQDTRQEEPLILPELNEKCVRLNVVLKSYGIQAHPIDETLVQQAARFIRFKLELKPGETEANLKKRSEDIARELEAAGEIFISRINGTRYIGLDVPFADSNRPLMLVEYLDRLSRASGALSVLAGQSPDGELQMIDLAKAPHMLIAGTTGSGKTIFLYSIIVSLLQQYSANELELLIVDPKQTDFHFFEGLPHLYGGRVLTDADEAIAALTTINAVDKQERTEQIKAINSRDIDSYNAKVTSGKMKRLVVVIDEYADLVQAAELQGKDVRKTFESNLCMLAQRVRNLGIHLIIATQQPRATIVTSQLKAVLPFRVSFRLPSHTDSQTILDRSGAEDLLGKGDMLMLTDSDMLRMQGFFITEDQLIDFIDLKKE